MAGETAVLQINKRPLQAIADLGGGSLLKGLSILDRIGQGAKKSWSNMAWLRTANDTVGADTLINLEWEVNYPFLLLGLIYKNDTSATGYISDIKVNGFTLMNEGVTIETGSAGNLLFSELASMDEIDWLFFLHNGAKFTLEGVAVNGDVVSVTPYGWNMGMVSAGF